MLEMFRFILGFFFVGFAGVFIIYLIVMLPAMYREARKYLRVMKEDLKLFFIRGDKENLYAITEKVDNSFSTKARELKEWYYLQFKEDPEPFLIFFGAIGILILGSLLIIFI